MARGSWCDKKRKIQEHEQLEKSQEHKQVKRMLNADTKLIFKIITYYHSTQSEDRLHKSCWYPPITTQLFVFHWYLTNLIFHCWCSTLFWFAGDPGSFRRCVSKSSLQTWSKSILLPKNHQKVFVETDHTDHTIQSFDTVETWQQTPGGYPSDHNKICLVFFVYIW